MGPQGLLCDLLYSLLRCDQLPVLCRDGRGPILKILHDFLCAHRLGDQKLLFQLLLIDHSIIMVCSEEGFFCFKLLYDRLRKDLHVAALILVGHIDQLHLLPDVLRQVLLNSSKDSNLSLGSLPNSPLPLWGHQA